MSSQRKIDSARANGAKSHGPQTEAGKRTAALNGVKHGLTAKTVILAHESKDEYDAALRDYIDHFQAVGKPEQDLVAQLAAVNWRLARYAAVECALLDKSILDTAEDLEEDYTHVDDLLRLGAGFASLCRNNNSPLALLNRYQARLHHEYQRILKSLQQMQAARQRHEAKLQSEPNPISEQPSARAIRSDNWPEITNAPQHIPENTPCANIWQSRTPPIQMQSRGKYLADRPQNRSLPPPGFQSISTNIQPIGC
jgi:hypothetical protein